MSKSQSKANAKASVSKSGAKKTAPTLPFAQLTRTRTSGGASGGRYNGKTRRLVIPASFAGKKVGVGKQDGLLLVGGSGNFACHPTQHFVTLPNGTIDGSETLTLESAEVPEAIAKACPDAVAYRLPKASGKASKTAVKASGKSGGKATAKASK